MSGTVSSARSKLRVLVDAPEFLADAVATVADGEPVDVDLVEAPLASPLVSGATTLVVVSTAPAVDQLVALGVANRSGQARLLVCAVGADARLLALGPALSVPTFRAIGPALAASRFVHATGGFEVGITTRTLGAADRVRLRRTGDRGPRLVRVDDGWLGLAVASTTARLGDVDDLAIAFEVLASTSLAPPPSLPRVEGADRDASLDVLVGPSRTLSDPASKAALEPYDLPLPIEELCATASRAAAESQRIGFPVRIALASPDLRPSDHPELVIEGVEGSARVREAFRELVALAERTRPSARILGVTVGASTFARGLVRVELERVAKGHLVAAIGFADPHGRASDDTVFVPLPAEPDGVRAAMARLRGASLLAPAGEDNGVLSRLTDVVLRSAAFLDDFAVEVDRVGLDPIALLEGGELEIREAYVHVTDSFTRGLERDR